MEVCRVKFTGEGSCEEGSDIGGMMAISYLSILLCGVVIGFNSSVNNVTLASEI